MWRYVYPARARDECGCGAPLAAFFSRRALRFASKAVKNLLRQETGNHHPGHDYMARAIKPGEYSNRRWTIDAGRRKLVFIGLVMVYSLF